MNELVEKIRAGLNYNGYEPGNPVEEAHDALDALVARLTVAERERDEAQEDAEERVARLRAKAVDIRLRDAETMGTLLDDAVEALEAAYTELERAEEHHRWHHEQEGREVEDDDERLRVLMVIAEALESLGANDDAARPGVR